MKKRYNNWRSEADFQIDDAEEMALVTGRKKYEEPEDNSQPGRFITLCLIAAFLLGVGMGIFIAMEIYFSDL